MCSQGERAWPLKVRMKSRKAPEPLQRAMPDGASEGAPHSMVPAKTAVLSRRRPATEPKQVNALQHRKPCMQ